MSSLFRPEAIDAQRQQWLGEVRLVRPLSLSLFRSSCCARWPLVIAFLVLGRVHAQGPSAVCWCPIAAGSGWCRRRAGCSSGM